MENGRLPFRPAINVPTTIGKIKIGELVTTETGKKYPTTLEYFRATGNFDKVFNATYGEKPTELDILFATDDEKSCEQFAEIYGGKILFAVMKNNTVFGYDLKCSKMEKKETLFSSNNWLEVEKFMIEYAEKLNELKPSSKAYSWNYKIRLNFFLPKIENVLGLWTFESKGSSMIFSIADTFDQAKKMFGSVNGILFKLTVCKVEQSTPNGKRIFSTVKLSIAYGIQKILEANKRIANGENSTDVMFSLMFNEPNKTQISLPEKTEQVQKIRLSDIAIEKAIERLPNETITVLNSLKKCELTPEQKSKIDVCLFQILESYAPGTEQEILDLWTLPVDMIERLIDLNQS